MPPLAKQKHHIAGRLRLQLSSAKGNAALFHRIRHGLEKLPGVRAVQVKPATAVVIVEYDPAQFTEFSPKLANFAAEQKLFVLNLAEDAGAEPQTAAEWTLDTGLGLLNRAVQSGTRNVISLKEAVPLGILAWAAVFVDPAAAASQWLSWVAFAWAIYFDTHQDEPVKDVARRVEALRSEIGAVRALLERSATKT